MLVPNSEERDEGWNKQNALSNRYDAQKVEYFDVHLFRQGDKNLSVVRGVGIDWRVNAMPKFLEGLDKQMLI